MDVFLMVRRKKTTIFIDAKETTTVKELKRILQGILKIEPDNQQLTNEQGTETYSDDKCLSEYHLSGSLAHAQNPATVGLSFRYFYYY
ncbi:UNVERIFIED_CONTAM: hypothetical protein GTU68_007666 [Idotea baltica]|nr:hypothetical protein [Idotea baltica]